MLVSHAGTGTTNTYLRTATLQWAITNAGINSFEFYDVELEKMVYSTNFVRKVLFAFMTRNAKYVPKNRLEKLKNDEEEFRKKLVQQIFELVGVRPKIKLEKDNRYAIWHS